MTEQPKQQPKPQQAQTTPKAEKQPKPPMGWGLSDAQCYEAWQGKPVVVQFSSGREVSGHLVGWGQYTLTLRLVDGAVVLVHKPVEQVRAT